MTFDDSIRFGTLIVAGASAIFSALGWYRQRLTSLEIERLKEDISKTRYIYEKRLQAREDILGFTTSTPLRAKLKSGICLEPEDIDHAGHALLDVSHELEGWWRRYSLFFASVSFTSIEQCFDDICTLCGEVTNSTKLPITEQADLLMKLDASIGSAIISCLNYLDCEMRMSMHSVIETNQIEISRMAPFPQIGSRSTHTKLGGGPNL